MRRALASLAILAAVAPAWAAERPFAVAPCELAASGGGVVDVVIDATTLRLAGGLEVRLAGILVPEPPFAPPLAAESARNALAALVSGRVVELRSGAIATDRYGRAVGHAFLADGTSVQLALLAAGAVVTAGLAEDRACLGDLLAAERGARAAGAGIWRETGVPDAADASLRGASGLYALVEGTVVSIGRTASTVYLNFGEDWSADLTVTATAAAARAMEAAGGPLDALAGTRVRIRGWLTQWDGPTIRVDHPEQIELLDFPAVPAP